MTQLELITNRRSVRHYSDMKVEREKLDYIMECARLAPSAVNFQPWHFYIIESDESKALIHKCYKRQWFSSPNIPIYIIACIDRSESWKRDYDGKDHGDIDIAIAVEHICLAATEMELATCWVCHFEPTLCKELLNLPENFEPAVIIPLGYPGIDKGNRTTRKDYNEIVTII